MYLRFIGHPQPGWKFKGLFQLTRWLKHSGRLSDRDVDLMQEKVRYFNIYLRVPTRFSPYRDYKRRESTALCWFKPEAAEMIERMRDLSMWLWLRGVGVRIQKAKHPGYIAYEDDHQIAAQPFRSTVCEEEVLYEAWSEEGE